MVNPDNIPQHIAVIMDGNGRWAKERGLAHYRGHQEGAKTVRDITRECARLKLDRLTLFAFSIENWKRPKREINRLMRLYKEYLIGERDEIMDNNIRYMTIGRREALSKSVLEEIDKTTEMSRGNTGMTLCLAVNYGGQSEIVDAAKKLAREAREGTVNLEDINEKTFSRYMYDPEMKPPDLLIRTAGEMRISNFLLWEISYSEIWVTPIMWPDFRKEDLHQAIRDYQERERRFGGR